MRIINEPYKFGVSGGKIYLEAHAPLTDAPEGQVSAVDKNAGVVNALLKREDLVQQVQMDWDRVREVVTAEDGLPVQIAAPHEAMASSETPLH